MARSAEALPRSLLAKLRIIVADGNPSFLQKLVVSLVVEFEVVATAAGGKSALDLIRRLHPHVAVVDLHIPIVNGIEIAKHLARQRPSPPVVICAVANDPEIVEAARKAGAAAYVFQGAG